MIKRSKIINTVSLVHGMTVSLIPWLLNAPRPTLTANTYHASLVCWMVTYRVNVIHLTSVSLFCVCVMCWYFELLFVKTKALLVMCTRHGKKGYTFFGVQRTAETLLLPGKERIIRIQHGRQRNCHPRQEYFRDDMGSEMSRKYLCSRQQLFSKEESS